MVGPAKAEPVSRQKDKDDGALSRRVPFPAATGHLKQGDTCACRQVEGNE